jgi:hypothetical protein
MPIICFLHELFIMTDIQQKKQDEADDTGISEAEIPGKQKQGRR